MALDVYVGSLTRYYAGLWENVAERQARERGMAAAGARAGAGATPDVAEVRALIAGWQTALEEALGTRVSAPLDWNERDEAPYFTGRPGWDGFGCLVLWAAYAEHPALRPPEVLAEEWDNDAALVRSNADGFRSRYSHLVRNVELWIPDGFDFTFEGEDVSGRRVVLGSAVTLQRQLADLNGATWKASSSVVAGWREDPPVTGTSLEARARYGFAVMADLVQRAVDHRLPMKLDY